MLPFYIFLKRCFFNCYHCQTKCNANSYAASLHCSVFAKSFFFFHVFLKLNLILVHLQRFQSFLSLK